MSNPDEFKGYVLDDDIDADVDVDAIGHGDEED